MTTAIDLGVHALRAAYAQGTLGVAQVIDEVLRRIGEARDDKLWISRVPDAVLRAEAGKLDQRRGERGHLPLYGIPFAVKDNIDVVAWPPLPPVPASPTSRSARPRRSDVWSRRAPSSWARPISTSSPPAWSACARPTACREILSTRPSCPAARVRVRQSPSRRAW